MKHRTRVIVRRVASNLARARAAAGLTQEQVARRMGVPVTQYARLERGEHDSGISKFLDAAWAIGMPPGELFDRLDTRIP